MRLSQMKFVKLIFITLLVFSSATPSNSAQESDILDFLPAILAGQVFDNDGDGYSEVQGDCMDTDDTIYPSAFEICGDGIDQDCDGGADPLCPEDIDNDGDGYTENQGDCNDGNVSINPGATDICGNGIDENCNGSDQLCPNDIDNDGDGYTENQGDCNDANWSINPNAEDVCGDGIDQDCNGTDVQCGGGGNGNCEVVTSGPSTLTIINDLNVGVSTNFQNAAFGSDIRPNTCEIYGYSGIQAVEFTQCNFSGYTCYQNTFGPTVTVSIYDGLTIRTSNLF